MPPFSEDECTTSSRHTFMKNFENLENLERNLMLEMNRGEFTKC